RPRRGSRTARGCRCVPASAAPWLSDLDRPPSPWPFQSGRTRHFESAPPTEPSGRTVDRLESRAATTIRLWLAWGEDVQEECQLQCASCALSPAPRAAPIGAIS